MITKPLLAARSDSEDLSTLRFPVGVTVKVDGIRCIKIGGKALSRTFKPIPNRHIRETIEKWVPDGMDMELLSSDNFQEATGNIMRHEGKPEFTIYVIDYVPNDLNEPYMKRMIEAFDYAANHWSIHHDLPFKWMVLSPTLVHNKEELDRAETAALEKGYEGIMVRDPHGRYKCGRSSFNEGILIKVKRFSDTEAEVLDFEELYHNENTAEKDAFGRTKRSTAQDGLKGGGTLGKLMVRGLEGDFKGVEFSVGSGFTQAQRDDLWKTRAKLKGQIVKVKYFPTGVKDAPRFPVFLGFRHKEDM
jgi:DNA ligase-1